MFCLCILRLFKLKTEGQTIHGKPHCKVVKLKSKFSLNDVHEKIFQH